MPKPKLIRITTVPLSMDKLLEGQLRYMSQFYHVTAVSSDPEKLKSIAEREGISYFAIPLTRQITPLTDFKALWKLYRFLRREKPLIVHTHTPKAGLIGILAAWLAGVPVRIHTVAGLPLMETIGLKRVLLHWLERLTYRLSIKVCPNSQGLAEFILSQKMTRKEKIKVIGKGSSNGIDVNKFNPDLISSQQVIHQRKILNISKEALVFSFLGRLVRDKGVQELVQAFNEISKDHPSVHLLLIGPFESKLDPLDKITLSLIKDHARIHALGYQDDIRPFLAVSDVFLFPSYREGFPNAVMQALSMEIPVIASDINGCNELIQHGVNGWLVPPKDALALEQKIRYVLDHPKVLMNVKKNTRISVERDFNQETIWKLLLQEYSSSIQEIS